MARQKRKLKYPDSNNFSQTMESHFDKNDELFASEHFGYYLMSVITKSSVIRNPRRYFYYKFK